MASSPKLPEGLYHAPPRAERGLTREQFDEALLSGKKTIYNDNFYCLRDRYHNRLVYECEQGCCSGEFETLDEAWEFMAADHPECLYVIPPDSASIQAAQDSKKCVSGESERSISGQKEPI